MFCYNCGSQLTGEERFCPHCGAAVANATAQNMSVQNAPAQNMPVPNTQNAQGADAPKEKKRKGSFAKKFAVGLLIILILAAAGAAVWYFFFGGKDIVEDSFLSKVIPQTRTAAAEAGEADSAAKAAEIYETLTRNFNPSDMSGEFSFGIELSEKGETLLDLIGGFAGVDLSGITKAEIAAEYKLGKEMAEFGLAAVLNKDNLISADIIYDETNAKLYVRIPELGSDYLSFEISVDEEYLLLMQESVSELYEILPQEDEIERMIRNYGEIFVNAAESFEREEKEKQTLTVAGVSQICTEVTVKISKENIEDLKGKLLDLIKEDPDLKEVIKRMIESESFEETEMNEDEIIAEIRDEAEAFFEELEELAEKEERHVLEIKFYKDNDELLGFETAPYSFLSAKSGNNVGYYMNAGGEYEITGNGELKNGLLTADFSVTDYRGDEYFIVSAKDWNIEGLNDMEFAGEFTIAPGKYLVEEMGDETAFGMFKLKNVKLRIRIDADAEQTDCSVTFVYRDDDYLTASFSYRNTDGSEITRPKDLTPIEGEEDLKEWIKTVKWDDVIDRLDRTALPDEAVAYLREMSGYLKKGDFEGLENYFYGLGGSAIPGETTMYY